LDIFFCFFDFTMEFGSFHTWAFAKKLIHDAHFMRISHHISYFY
jgi:hypothetical protein